MLYKIVYAAGQEVSVQWSGKRSMIMSPKSGLSRARELRVSSNGHNFVPAPWACLSEMWLALRTETTDRDDRR